jgi:hypothetical protein
MIKWNECGRRHVSFVLGCFSSICLQLGRILCLTNLIGTSAFLKWTRSGPHNWSTETFLHEHRNIVIVPICVKQAASCTDFPALWCLSDTSKWYWYFLKTVNVLVKIDAWIFAESVRTLLFRVICGMGFAECLSAWFYNVPSLLQAVDCHILCIT